MLHNYDRNDPNEDPGPSIRIESNSFHSPLSSHEFCHCICRGRGKGGRGDGRGSKPLFQKNPNDSGGAKGAGAKGAKGSKGGKGYSKGKDGSKGNGGDAFGGKGAAIGSKGGGKGPFVKTIQETPEARQLRYDTQDAQFGYERYLGPERKIGWLLNMHQALFRVEM